MVTWGFVEGGNCHLPIGFRRDFGPQPTLGNEMMFGKTREGFFGGGMAESRVFMSLMCNSAKGTHLKFKPLTGERGEGILSAVRFDILEKCKKTALRASNASLPLFRPPVRRLKRSE